MDKNRQAIEYMREQKYEEAAVLFNEIIEENPEDPVGYINFGNLLLHINDYERAERFFNRALELDAHAATAYYGLGNTYFEQADYKQAKDFFKKAIDHGLDEEADVYYMLGFSLQKEEQNLLAIPFLQRAAELDPDNEEFLFQYGLALAQNNHIDQAESVFHEVLSKNKQHSDAYYNLGVISLFKENAEAALEYFHKAVDIQPGHILAQNGIKQVENLLNGNE